jgi:hypothetical protein
VILIVDKEVRFRVLIDDQATAELKRIIEEIKKFSQTTASATVGVAQGATGGGGRSGVPSDQVMGDFSPYNPGRAAAERARLRRQSFEASKGLGGGRNGTPSQHAGSPNALIPGEMARPLRAAGMYRTAWLAGQDLGGGGAGGMAMKGAAGLFILQAIGDTAKKIFEVLKESSPLLRAEFKILKVAFGEFIRPIADVVGTALRPLSRMMLKSNAFARSTMAAEGISQQNLGEYYSRFAAGMMATVSGKDILGADKESTLGSAGDINGFISSMGSLIDTFINIDFSKLKDPLTGMVDAVSMIDGQSLSGMVTGMNEIGMIMPNMVKNLNDMNNALAPLAKAAVDASNAMSTIEGVGKTITDPIGSIGNMFNGLKLW